MQNISAQHERGKFFDRPWVVWKQNYFPSQITNTLGTLTWSGRDRRLRSDVPNTEYQREEERESFTSEAFWRSYMKSEKGRKAEDRMRTICETATTLM